MSAVLGDRRVTGWLDRLQRRHPLLAFPLAVAYKFFDDHGNHLAALLTYYGFVSLFPLLLLLASVLGFVLRGDAALQQRILDSTLSQLPLLGTELQRPGGLRGSSVALTVGAVTALYGALGVAQALQHTMNSLWAVPRYRRPNPLLARLRSVLLLAIAGLAVLGTTVLSAISSGTEVFGTALALLVTLLAVAVNTAVFTAAFRLATARTLRVADVLPGAVCAAFLWQLLQRFGAFYVARVLQDSSVYGTFALVLGLLAWIYLAAVAVVVSVEVNVVRSKGLYPRSLLTPFTDDVRLTTADRAVYRDTATAQSFKRFETIDVTFDEPPLAPVQPARRARRTTATRQTAATGTPATGTAATGTAATGMAATGMAGGGADGPADPTSEPGADPDRGAGAGAAS